MGKRIVVIGDSITDVYRKFQYKKQCPDALNTPVGVLSGIDIRPGGAANVAVNLAALVPSDVSVELVSIIDVDNARAIKRVSSNRVNLDGSVIVEERDSLRKERIILDSLDSRFIARLDNRSKIGDLIHIDSFHNEVASSLDSDPKPEFVVLSDYAGGTLTPFLISKVMEFRDRLLIDTKETDLTKFRGSLLIKLNSSEYRRVREVDPYPEKNCRFLVHTRGKAGAQLIIRNDVEAGNGGWISTCSTVDFPSKPVDCVDVCGCGDTFLAGLAAGLLRFSSVFEATLFANAAASTVVIQPRTAVANLTDSLCAMGRVVQ